MPYLIYILTITLYFQELNISINNVNIDSLTSRKELENVLPNYVSHEKFYLEMDEKESTVLEYEWGRIYLVDSRIMYFTILSSNSIILNPYGVKIGMALNVLNEKLKEYKVEYTIDESISRYNIKLFDGRDLFIYYDEKKVARIDLTTES